MWLYKSSWKANRALYYFVTKQDISGFSTQDIFSPDIILPKFSQSGKN